MNTAFNHLLIDSKHFLIDSSSNNMIINRNDGYIYKSFGKVVSMSNISRRDEQSFEVDKNRTLLNFEQTSLIKSLGISSVKHISIADDHSYIKMSELNDPLLNSIIVNHKFNELYAERLGILLADIHKKLNAPIVTHSEVKKFEIDERFNAHCARNLKIKTSGWLEKLDGRSLNNSNFEMIFKRSLINALDQLEKNPNYLSEKDVIFGDFKPDNLFVTYQLDFIVIDPLLTLGRYSCDLGKLGARVYLIDRKTFIDYFPLVVNSYTKNSDTKVNKQEIMHMIAYDILNLFSKMILLHHKNIISDETISKYENEFIEGDLESFLKGELPL